jgi:hypothetical protein
MAYFRLNEKDTLLLENQPSTKSTTFPYNVKKVYRTFMKNRKYQPTVWLEHYDMVPKKKTLKPKKKNRRKNKHCPLLEPLNKGKYCPLLVHEDPVIYNSQDLLNDLLTSSEDEEDYSLNKIYYTNDETHTENPQFEENHIVNTQYNNKNDHVYNDVVIYIKTEEDCKDDIKLFNM